MFAYMVIIAARVIKEFQLCWHKASLNQECDKL